tara:strand:+ start:3011 stop:3532 length:522 start_codon:yes stop_codon:yes gene_type:complete
MGSNILGRFIFTCAAGLIVMAGTASAVELRGGTEQDYAALSDLAETWMQTYASGDVKTLMPYYDSHTHMMPEGLRKFRGPDEIRPYFKESIGAVDLVVVNNLEEIEVNGTWAYLIGVFAAKVTPKDGGESGFVGGRYMILLRKDPDGVWRVLRDMDNSTTDTAPLISRLKGAD